MKSLLRSLLAAMVFFVALPIAAQSAAAAVLAAQVDVLYDGQAPFEDWAPGDTIASGPTGNGTFESGDDLAADDGVVRTLDVVMYRVAYSINPPMPATDVVLELTVTDAAFQDGWGLPTSTCPGGQSFNANRTTFECRLGTVTAAAPTTSIDVPTAVPASSLDGSSTSMTMRLYEAATPASAQIAVSPLTRVSAAPRYEVFKSYAIPTRATPTPGPGALSSQMGFELPYVVGLRAADLDPRGNSALAMSNITLVDKMSGSSQYVINGDCLSTWSNWPGHSTSAHPMTPTNQTSQGDPVCTQPAGAGGPVNVMIPLIWDRIAPPPTDANGPLINEKAGIIAFATLNLWVPVSEVDMADGTADSSGSMTVANGVDLTSAGSPAGGTCSATSVWSPGAAASTFDPVDNLGRSNLGAGVEPTADNGVCDPMKIVLDGQFYKYSTDIDGTGVIAGTPFTSRMMMSNENSTVPYPAGIQMCDKWDNDRFFLTGPVTNVMSGWPVTSPYSGGKIVQYGVGPWGTGTADPKPSEYFRQTYRDCADASMLPIPGVGTLWVDSSQVDWTNSGLKQVNADQLNTVRVTLTSPVGAGEADVEWTTWEAVPRTGLVDVADRQLRNYAAYNFGSGWSTSTCPGADALAQQCPEPLGYISSAGDLAAWWTLVDGTARITKTLDSSISTFNAGDTAPWMLDVEVVPSIYALMSATGGTTHAVTVADVLPANLSYVAGSATATRSLAGGPPIAYAVGEPTVLANTPTAGKTSLVWSLGDQPWGTRLDISFDTDISMFAPTGTITNVSKVETPDDPTPADSGSWYSYRKKSTASLNVTALSRAAISKASTTPAIAAGDVAEYALAMGNPSADPVEFMDAVDILPFDGDLRGSVIAPSSMSLSSVAHSIPNLETWVSATDPTVLDTSDGTTDGHLDPRVAGVSVGSSDWPCTYAAAAAATPGCPTLDQVTALRFVGSDPDPSGSGAGRSFLPAGSGPFFITLQFNTTTAAKVGDTYRNSWLAAFEGLPLPVYYDATVYPTIAPVGIGNLVFVDVNADGHFTAGVDTPVNGVKVDVYADGATPGTDPPVGTATTDGDGRWFVGSLSSGSYFAVVAASNFDAGGPLEGRSPATGASGSDNQRDEGLDHNATGGSASTGYRSPVIVLAVGSEPTGEAGTLPAGYRDSDVDSTVDFGFSPLPSLALTNTVTLGHNGGSLCPGDEKLTVAAGTAVTYCFTITNNGDVPLTDWVLDDPDLGITFSGTATLAPGASITKYYETTAAADLVNHATVIAQPSLADGTPIALDSISATDPSEVAVVAPEISLVTTVYPSDDGSASCPGVNHVTVATGSLVTWCFTITNTGDTSLTVAQLTDSGIPVDLADMTLVSGDPTLMAPGDVVVYSVVTTASTAVTASTSVTGNPVDDSGDDLPYLDDVTDTSSASVDVVDASVSLSNVVAEGSHTAPCGGSELITVPTGTTVTYCFTITNTGSATLGSWTFTDTDLGITLADLTVEGSEPSSLAPGDSVTYYYTTTASNALSNNAVVTAHPVDASGADYEFVPDVTAEDPSEVAVIDPAISITNTVVVSGACPGAELVTVASGTEVTYCFVITNNGDTDLVNIDFADPALGITFDDVTFTSAHPTALAPGASITFTWTTTATVDLDNTATVTATPTDASGVELVGHDLEVTDPSGVAVVAADIALTKTVFAGDDSGGSCPGSENVTVLAGDTVTWCYTVTNTGDTALSALEFSDPSLGLVLSDLTPVGTIPAVLLPGDSASWYYVDVRSVDVSGDATITANPVESDGTDLPALADVTAADPASADVVFPAIELQKTVVAGHSAGAGCPGVELVTGTSGTAVTWCFTATNTGDTYLSDLQLTDPALGPMVLLSGDPTLVAPGESVTWYFESTITKDLSNDATVVGTPSDSDGVAAVGLADVSDLDPAGVAKVDVGISLSKTVASGTDAACPGVDELLAAIGAPLTWCFVVTNTSSVYLDDLSIEDAALGLATADLTVVSGDMSHLAPGASVVLRYSGPSTGTLHNTATVSGVPSNTDGSPIPGLTPPTATDDATVTKPDPNLTVNKTVAAGSSATAACPGSESLVLATGSAVVWCVEVINTGDVAVINVALDDPALGIHADGFTVLSGSLSILRPGERAMVAYATTATASLVNVVTASAVPATPSGTPIPGASPVTATDDATLTVVSPEVTLTKVAVDSAVSAGAQTTFRFTVNNNSAVDFGQVEVKDELFGECSRMVTLAANSTATFDCAVAAPSASFTNTAVVVFGDHVVRTEPAHATVTVAETPVPKSFAFTGSTVVSLLITALGSVMVGVAVMLAHRRRQQDRKPPVTV